jgi:glucose-6-phosphate isomerase
MEQFSVEKRRIISREEVAPLLSFFSNMKTSSPATTSSPWQHFQEQFLRYDSPDIWLDTSLITFAPGFSAKMKLKVDEAFAAMDRLEAGELANTDEKRMVGHYWLRNPAIVPKKLPEVRRQIESDLKMAREFAAQVHNGTFSPQKGGKFTDVLVIGIGGSALGPQLVADALGGAADRMRPHFFDNTDPEGMQRVLEEIGTALRRTLCVVISKSGGTAETRNGMLVATAAYEAKGLDFGRHTVAVTGVGSKMDAYAIEHKFLNRFPMQDWVGGRTSVMHTVGLVPMFLLGVNVDELLRGAREMDAHTRRHDAETNMAMRLALTWHAAGGGKGARDMVILPYKDRLVLFSKYLQQLVMESLGKRLDAGGKVVHQGIAVYGNKGSTDQHAYVQQLRDGLENFFATFVEVRSSGGAVPAVEVEPGVASGDFLQGFLRGTRKALAESGRQSVTISIPRVDARSLGALIALYERAVGFYASLVNINAYHQPGVEAGKKAAGDFLCLLKRVRGHLEDNKGAEFNAEEIAAALTPTPEDVFHALNHLEANHAPKIRVRRGKSPAQDRFSQLKD